MTPLCEGMLIQATLELLVAHGLLILVIRSVPLCERTAQTQMKSKRKHAHTRQSGTGRGSGRCKYTGKEPGRSGTGVIREGKQAQGGRGTGCSTQIVTLVYFWDIAHGKIGGESINLNQNKHKRVREGLNDLCFNAAHRVFTVVFCEDYLCERISEAALLPFYLTHNSKRLKIKAS